MIRAAIFDLDGTLVDSNELHVLAWQETFRHFGQEIPIERLREQIGKGGDQYLPVFLTEVEMSEFGTQADEYRGRIFKKKYLPRVRPFPKVRELFERVRHDGKKIALASSGKEDEVRHYERLAGIKGLADSLVTADQVTHSNRNPTSSSRRCGPSAISRRKRRSRLGTRPTMSKPRKKLIFPSSGFCAAVFPKMRCARKAPAQFFAIPPIYSIDIISRPLLGNGARTPSCRRWAASDAAATNESLVRTNVPTFCEELLAT